MKIPVKSVADIGQIIRVTRISQNLDQLTAAQLSNAGQSFLSHLENGKATAQIGKVLQVLESLGIGIELTLPPDVDALLSQLDNSSKNHNSRTKTLISYGDIDKTGYSIEKNLSFNKQKLTLLPTEDIASPESNDIKKALLLWEKVINSKRVRR